MIFTVSFSDGYPSCKIYRKEGFFYPPAIFLFILFILKDLRIKCNEPIKIFKIRLLNICTQYVLLFYSFKNIFIIISKYLSPRPDKLITTTSSRLKVCAENAKAWPPFYPEPGKKIKIFPFFSPLKFL